MQRNGFGHDPHVPFKAIEPVLQNVKSVPYGIFNRGSDAQKAFKGGFHDHALADARTLCCRGKSAVEVLGEPDGHLVAPLRSRPGKRWGFGVSVASLHIDFTLELHDRSSHSSRTH